MVASVALTTARFRHRVSRRLSFCFCLGVLLAAGALGGAGGGVLAQQEPDEDRLASLAMPVQTVVDAFPELVEEAILEAEYDGRPDRAQALLAQMEGYVANFSKPHAWPEGSAADQVAYQEALLFAADVVALSQIVPDMAARVEIVRASCGAFESASGEEAQAWLQDVREGRVDHGALLAGLADTKRALPVTVDVAPLERGIALLEEWGNGSLQVSLACSEEAAVYFDVYEPDDRLTFFARPTVVWPTASVQFFGAVGRDTDAAEVTLSAAGLGLQQSVTVVDSGGFHVRHGVPRDTTLGDHEAVAAAGGHEENVTVTVEKAPVSMVVEHPARVEPGRTFTLVVRLVDPLDGRVDGGEVQVSGGREEVMAIRDGRGSVRWTAPEEPGVLQGELSYAGDAIRAPATGSYRVRVQEEAVGAEPGEGVQAGDGSLFGLDRALVEAILGVVAAVLVAVMLFLMVVRFWQARRLRKGGPVAGAGETQQWEQDLAPGAGMTFAHVFAALHGWCVRHGLVEPGATARDMTRRMGAAEPLRRATGEFERVRYGGAQEQPARSRWAMKSTLAAWRDGMKRFIRQRS